jgi:hypothetical protein
MIRTMTLKQLIEEHPDWLNYELVVYCPDGHYDYVGAAGDVYIGNDNGKAVIVFSAN